MHTSFVICCFFRFICLNTGFLLCISVPVYPLKISSAKCANKIRLAFGIYQIAESMPSPQKCIHICHLRIGYFDLSTHLAGIVISNFVYTLDQKRNRRS